MGEVLVLGMEALFVGDAAFISELFLGLGSVQELV